MASRYELDKPLPDPRDPGLSRANTTRAPSTRAPPLSHVPTHTRSVSKPENASDLATATIEAQANVPFSDSFKESRYPAWGGPDPAFDNPQETVQRMLRDAARVSRSFREGSDEDVNDAAAVRLPP